jgi:cytochrome P450
LFGGGVDTTASAEYGFFLAMILFPEVQKKAQAEIDAVVGSERLPTFADQPNLPYVNALATELLRWHSVVPLGMAFLAIGRIYFRRSELLLKVLHTLLLKMAI